MRVHPYLWRALGAAVGGVLLVHFGLAAFSAPAADDYCLAVQVRELGFVDAQLYWYRATGGRYAAIAVLSGFGLSDMESTYPLVGLAALVLTCLAFLALVASVVRGRLSPAGTLLCAGVLSVLFISGLPDIAQTVYWASGAFVYQMGNVALIALLAILIRCEIGAPSRGATIALWLAAAALVPFAVGANEIGLILTVGLLACGTVRAVRSGRAKLFWAGLCVVALFFAAVFLLAPGSANRAAAIAADPGLRPPSWLAAIGSLPWAALMLLSWSSSLGVWAATVLVLGATWQRAREVLYRDGAFERRWLGVPLAWLGSILLLNLVFFASTRYPPPERTQSVLFLFFLLGWLPSLLVLVHWLSAGALEGVVSRLAPAAALLLAVSVLGAPNVFEAYKDTYRGYRYFLETRHRFELIRQAKANGRADLTLPSLSRPPRTLFAAEITTDAADFRNACMAQYHGLRSIRLGPPD